MGLLDSIMGGGGGGLDTYGAEMANKEAQWTLDHMLQRSMAANQPFLDYGEASLDKLSNLLGLEKPNRMQFDSVEALADHMRPVWWSSNSGARTGRIVYYDPLLGQVSGVTNGIDTGLRTKTGSEEDLMSAAQSLWDKYGGGRQQEVNADTGSLLRKFDMEQDYEQSPNYQFNLAEGEKALNRAAASRGDFYDPEAVKELQKYGSDLASQEFLNSYGMFQDQRDSTFNKLLGVADRGQQAVGQEAAVGQQYATDFAGLKSAEANLDLSAQAANNQRKQSAFGSLAGIAAGAAGKAFGGPVGAAAGNWLAGRVFG